MGRVECNYPLAREMLCSVVATAVQDHVRYRRMQEEIDRTSRMFGLMTRSEFHFRSLDHGRELAKLLANACPDPRKAVVGIGELLVNPTPVRAAERERSPPVA